ncbi:MAG TPA: GAF domain-containing protein, partial [Aggregatilineales bacterium]|nr:GAF domain-containing protein [Aggregatilineales bacterium]
MNDTPATWITVALVMSLLGAGLLAGLFIGLRWDRIKRSASTLPSGDNELDRLAGIGRAILGAQLKLDALCEVVYEQASSIVEARDFQLGLFEGDDYAIKIWLRAGERLPAQRFPGAAKAGLIGWVHQSAQVLRVNDFQREWNSLPAKPVYDSASPPRSAVFAPLLAAGQVIGVMAIYSDHADAFSDQALHLLTVLSSQAAGAIRNAQLFEQTERRAHQLHVIGEVSRQIVAMQPLPDLFRQIVTLIQDTFHYYAVSILTPDEDSGLIRLRASNYQEIERRKYALKPGDGLIGAAFERAETLYVPDVTNDPRYIYRDSLEQTKSEICVPLAVEKRVLGILDVQSDSLNAFSADDIATLEALAAQIAMALQEAQTYDTERRQAERINAMAEASRAVVSILDINDLLDQVVELVADHFGYDRVHLFLRSGDEIVFRSGSGVHSGKWTIQRLSFGLEDKGFIPWVARNGQSLVSGNAQSDERFVPVPEIEDSRSEMTIPIRMGQRVLGVFDIQSTQANAFNAEDVRLVQALADTVAIGLRNAGLFATETRRRMLAESLREVSTVLASSLDLPSVLDGILVGLERVVHYDAAIILLREEEQAIYTVNAFRGSQEAPDMLGETVPADDQLTEHVQELIHRIQPAEVAQLDDRQHDHLYVALQVGGKDIGVLGSERSGPDHFTPEDVEIITTFANQAAVAIANAQLYMAQKEEAWISTALLQVAEATGRATNLDDVLRTVARITPLLVGVQWCAVFLANSDSFRVVEVEGADPELAEQLRGYTIKDADWEPLAHLRHAAKPVVIGSDTPRPANMNIQGPRIQQGVLLPLIAKGEVMGAMLIGQQGNVELMTARKIELVSGIANQAALAIESSQLFTAQQEEAWVTTALLSVAESLNSVLGLDQTMETIVRLVPMLVGTERCGI